MFLRKNNIGTSEIRIEEKILNIISLLNLVNILSNENLWKLGE